MPIISFIKIANFNNAKIVGIKNGNISNINNIGKKVTNLLKAKILKNLVKPKKLKVKSNKAFKTSFLLQKLN